MITAVSIPSTIAVYGNGKAMGFRNGNNQTAGLMTATLGGAQGALLARPNYYNKNIGTQGSGDAGIGNNIAFGIVSNTDGTSGLIAKSDSITRTSKSFKFCIKY